MKMTQLIKKNFADFTNHKAKIMFIGKRSLNPVTTPSKCPGIVKEEVPKAKENYDNHKSTLNIISNLRYRPKITKEESEVINNGGILNYKLDWDKIKLKEKNKKLN